MGSRYEENDDQTTRAATTTIDISQISGFYINLDFRNDRKNHMERQLDLIGIRQSVKRFNAIKNVNGRVGCSLSHLKCIQMAKENNLEYVLILEDDVLFLLPDNFVENVNKFLSNKKINWDVLLLAGNNLPPFTINDDLSIRVTHCQTTTGYIVKSHYYDTLITNIKDGIVKLMKNPEHHYYFAIDKYWLQLQKQHRWMLLTPIIVVQRPDYSDIEKKYTDYQRVMMSIDKSDYSRGAPDATD